MNSLQLQRDNSQVALVPVTARHQNFPDGAIPGKTNESPIEAEVSGGRGRLSIQQTAKSELDLQFYGEGKQLEVVVEYAQELFEPQTIERLLRHHERVLEELVAKPALSLSRFSLLTKGEEELILGKWNATQRVYEEGVSVVGRFEREVERRPEAVACLSEAGEWSYGRLNARANQLAHALKKCGVGPEVRVGLCLERSGEFVAALMGIFKAGGVYVPLDPQHPDQYLREIGEDAQLQAVITRRGLVGRLEGLGIKVVEVEATGEEPLNNPPEVLGPEHLAYILYTSGSTGRSKGVMVTHRQVLNLLPALWERLPFGENEVVAQKTVAGFVISLKEMLSGLLQGVPQVLIPDEKVKDITFTAELARWGVTRLNIVPSHLETLLSTLESPEQARTLRALKYCVTAGEPLTQAVRAQVKAKLPWVKLWNNYGCTELNDTTYCGPEEQGAGNEFVPIGRPIANTRAYVLDENLRPVPVGVAGELCVSAIGIPRGYWRQPGLTAERFIADPFSGEPGGRLYRTGDMVRYLEDGTLDYLGRKDFEVKIRGHRIDVRQVENKLGEYPGIGQWAVKAWKGEGQAGAQLIAYYVASGAQKPPVEALREYLTERLPGYMVPSLYLEVEKMPRLANGKLDRRSLPAPDATAMPTSEYVAPRNPQEEILAGVFAETLKLARVGLNDSFFALGGHSLLAISLISRIRSTLGVEVNIRTLFETPTVAGLAERLKDAQAARPELQALPRPERIPLSFSQERQWFVHQYLASQRTAYSFPNVQRWSGPFEVEAFRWAFAALVRRHEILRTSFPALEGEPVQVIAPSLELDIPVVELKGGELEQYIQRYFQDVFDLSRGPLLKVAIVRLAPTEHMVLANLHPLLTDGWSMRVMARELKQLYAGRVAGGEPTLPPLPIQYADYACWQRQQDLTPLLAYWKSALTGYEEGLALPYDHPRPPSRNWRMRRCHHVYPAELASRLSQFSREQGSTLFMTLLTGLYVVLSRYTGRTDLCVSTTVAGRDYLQLESLIGFFVNVLALRVDLSGDPSGEEMVRRVKTVTLKGYEHQALPFEHLLNSLQLQRDNSQVALVPVTARHQNFPDAMAKGEGKGRLSIQQTVQSEIDVQFYGEGAELEVVVEYAQELFKAGTIERLVRHHERVLEELVAKPAQPLSQLQLLSAPEETAMEQWNRTERPLQEGVSVVGRFEREVERRPEAVACLSEAGEWSYGRLNARANQLAHALKKCGVGPEVRVGLCLERSGEFVAALMGIFKAGGVYVPLDTAAPGPVPAGDRGGCAIAGGDHAPGAGGPAGRAGDQSGGSGGDRRRAAE